jgi:hypothetical protein
MDVYLEENPLFTSLIALSIVIQHSIGLVDLLLVYYKRKQGLTGGDSPPMTERKVITLQRQRHI